MRARRSDTRNLLEVAWDLPWGPLRSASESRQQRDIRENTQRRYLLFIAHYGGENGRKFVVTNKQWPKIDGFEQKSCRKVHGHFGIKKRTEAELQLETVDPTGHVRTNVRREHQARAHVRTSEESTKRTVHIQQWGSHPLSLAGWQGPAKLFAN